MLARVVSSAVFIALVSAQPEPASYSSSPSSTSNGYAAIHTVNVGRGNFQFDPNETYANPGDIVTFNFFPTNHSVVRAAYGLPCIPYEETGNNLTGFYSGNFLVDNLANVIRWPVCLELHLLTTISLHNGTSQSTIHSQRSTTAQLPVAASRRAWSASSTQTHPSLSKLNMSKL